MSYKYNINLREEQWYLRTCIQMCKILRSFLKIWVIGFHHVGTRVLEK